MNIMHRKTVKFNTQLRHATNISAKYYLNWFSFHTVIMKVLGVNFFLKHSVVVVETCLWPENKAVWQQTGCTLCCEILLVLLFMCQRVTFSM